jgi:hypothetical protein
MGDRKYGWFFDGASGSSAGGDAAAHAIAHRDRDGRIVIDLAECVWPRFDPATVVRRFAERARPYYVREITGDAWAGEWPRAAFEGLGIRYRVAEKPKGELYRELLPLFSSRRIVLPDDPVLVKQLLGLERRTARSGREMIDHGAFRGAHDDLSNVIAGAAYEVRERHEGPMVAAILPADRYGQPSSGDWRRPYFDGPAARKRTYLEAPRRETPSDAMLECREQRREVLERDRQLVLEQARHELKLQAAAKQAEAERLRLARWIGLGGTLENYETTRTKGDPQS